MLEAQDEFPIETYSGNWQDEVGAYFGGYLIRPPKDFARGPNDSMWHVGVFQFTLPAPKCDSIVYWGAKGTATGGGWSVANEGRMSTEWVQYISPSGSSFPPWLRWSMLGLRVHSYTIFQDGLWEGPGTDIGADMHSFHGDFAVKEGVQPRLYLGLSVAFFFIQNGKAEIPPLDSFFHFAPGLTYIMVPDD